VDLRIRCGLQRVTVQAHEELPSVAVLDPVSIKDVTVKRIEDEKANRAWLSCTFVLVFSLESKTARNFVLDEFGKPLLWSFEHLQGDLLSVARMHEAAARFGEAGDCTLTVPGSDPVTFNAETAKTNREAARKLRDQAKTH